MRSFPILAFLPLCSLAHSRSRDIRHRANTDLSVNLPLLITDASPEQVIKPATKLRILCVGDSITVGHSSEEWDGYGADLKSCLSHNNDVVFAGTEHRGTLTDGYFVRSRLAPSDYFAGCYQAAWNGKTIQFLADHIGPSLEHRPNLILLHAGTNDMAPLDRIAKEGNDPQAAAERLGHLIDMMIQACPDAVIIVAVIVNSCQSSRVARTKEYQALIPGVVQQRFDDGHQVLAADFTTISDSFFRKDCIHPSTEGYEEMSRYWYDFITQIPKTWLGAPRGDDPVRDVENEGSRQRSAFSGLSVWLVVTWHILVSLAFN